MLTIRRALSVLGLPARMLVAAGRPTATNLRLVEAFARADVDAQCVRPAQALRRARPGDRVLGRVDVRPTLDGPEPGLAHLDTLSRLGVEVLNPPAALLAMHDKLGTSAALRAAGVPHPHTVHVHDVAVPDVAFPVVVKPRFGSWGRDVELCESAGDLARCLRALRRRAWFRRHGVLVQQLVPPLGRDLRVVVAAGEVVGAIQRVSAPGEWRTNVALGGTREPASPPADARLVALAAAHAVGADLAGVDLLPLPGGGWTVLELNGAVDFTDEYSLGGEDVFEAVARALVPVEVPLREPVAALGAPVGA